MANPTQTKVKLIGVLNLPDLEIEINKYLLDNKVLSSRLISIQYLIVNPAISPTPYSASITHIIGIV